MLCVIYANSCELTAFPSGWEQTRDVYGKNQNPSLTGFKSQQVHLNAVSNGSSKYFIGPFIHEAESTMPFQFYYCMIIY